MSHVLNQGNFASAVVGSQAVWLPVELPWERVCELRWSHHVTTRGSVPPSLGCVSEGTTVWLADNAEKAVYLSWTWAQLSEAPLLVELTDQLSIKSNLRLCGPDGQVLDELHAAFVFHRAICNINWQSAVLGSVFAGFTNGGQPDTGAATRPAIPVSLKRH